MGQKPSDDVKALSSSENEIDALRVRTQSLVEELERRMVDKLDTTRVRAEKVRHALDFRDHARRHPVAVSGLGVGLMAAIGVGIYFGIKRHRAANRPMARARRKAGALRQILADPERIVRGKSQQTVGQRVLSAVLVTAATVLVRNIAKRALV